MLCSNQLSYVAAEVSRLFSLSGQLLSSALARVETVIQHAHVTLSILRLTANRPYCPHKWHFSAAIFCVSKQALQSEQDQDARLRDTAVDQAIAGFAESYWHFDESGLLKSWCDSENTPYDSFAAELCIGMRYEEFLAKLTDLGSVTNVPRIRSNNEADFLHHLKSGQLMTVKHTALSNKQSVLAAFDVSNLKAEQQTSLGLDSKVFDFTRISTDWSWAVSYTHLTLPTILLV